MVDSKFESLFKAANAEGNQRLAEFRGGVIAERWVDSSITARGLWRMNMSKLHSWTWLILLSKTRGFQRP